MLDILNSELGLVPLTPPNFPINESVQCVLGLLLVALESSLEHLHHHLAGHVETFLAVMITIVLVGLA